MKNVKIIRVFTKINMRLGHDGLLRVARENGVKTPERFQNSELLMFINRNLDKLKIVGGGGRVVGYLRMLTGEKISLEAIQYLPATFGASGGWDYPSALKMTLKNKLKLKESAEGVFFQKGNLGIWTGGQLPVGKEQ